jgi:hypothetical protein
MLDHPRFSLGTADAALGKRIHDPAREQDSVSLQFDDDRKLVIE